MNVIKFLLRNSKGFVVLIVLIGTVGGLCNAGLIALIHAALTDSDLSALTLAWAFAGVCVLTLLSNITAQLLLLRLSQGSILELRLRLSQQILKTPLRRIEEVGPARLLTALSSDAGTLAQALFSVPLLCINIATLTACMIYIGLLSKFLLVALMIYMALGIVSYHLPIRRSLRYNKQARREMEKLFTHFRALTDGNKELKLHRARRDEVFSEDLKASAITLQYHTVRGMSIHIVAES